LEAKSLALALRVVALTPSLVLIGAGIWHQTNPVTDLHDTNQKPRRQKKMESIYGADFWSVCHGC